MGSGPSPTLDLAYGITVTIWVAATWVGMRRRIGGMLGNFAVSVEWSRFLSLTFGVVFRAAVMVKIVYCAPAWSGLGMS